MRYKRYIIVLMSMMAAAGGLAAVPGTTSVNPLFVQGNTLYEHGKFADARAAYEELARQLERSGKTSPEVFYNIGNCWFRENKFGWARYYYERARATAPADGDTAHNIRHLLATVGISEPSNFFQAVFDAVPRAVVYAFLLAANIAFFGLLIAAMFSPNPWLRRFAALAGVLLAVMLVWYAGKHSLESVRRGVIVEPGIVRSAPEEDGSVGKSVSVNEAKLVHVISEKDDYYAVYLPFDKIQGWMKKGNIKVIPQ